MVIVTAVAFMVVLLVVMAAVAFMVMVMMVVAAVAFMVMVMMVVAAVAFMVVLPVVMAAVAFMVMLPVVVAAVAFMVVLPVVMAAVAFMVVLPVVVTAVTFVFMRFVVMGLSAGRPGGIPGINGDSVFYGPGDLCQFRDQGIRVFRGQPQLLCGKSNGGFRDQRMGVELGFDLGSAIGAVQIIYDIDFVHHKKPPVIF